MSKYLQIIQTMQAMQNPQAKQSNKAKAVVLLSGGLDSTTLLALASQYYECYALSIFYGQKHAAELNAAKKIADYYQVKHEVLHLDLSHLLASSLTDKMQSIPSYLANQQASLMGQNIPSTYVPARNTLMLSFALAWAESIEAKHIFYGANAIDYSGYPDCRPEYVAAFEDMANLATKKGVEYAAMGQKFVHIHAPIIDLHKFEIIELGMHLGVDYSKTVSCYSADFLGRACGVCDACHLRKQGFELAGFNDPTHYIE